MRVFEITDYEYEPDIERDEGSALPPFGTITFVLQFTGLAIKLDVFVEERRMWLSEYFEFGFSGDSVDQGFIFDTKKEYEDFLSLILQKSQEITGRTLMWYDWRDDLDDDDDDRLGETTIIPPPNGERTLAVA
jgi:hypothetical protein